MDCITHKIGYLVRTSNITFITTFLLNLLGHSDFKIAISWSLTNVHKFKKKGGIMIMQCKKTQNVQYLNDIGKACQGHLRTSIHKKESS